MAPWMMSPTITVTMYIPSCLPTTSRSLIEMILPQMRQAIPKGEYLSRGESWFYFLQSQLFMATTEDLAMQLASHCFCKCQMTWEITKCYFLKGITKIPGWLSKWANEILKWYWPHDHDDKFHHNLIEDVEEVNHESGLLSHLTHADAKCNKETNQTCGRKWQTRQTLNTRFARWELERGDEGRQRIQRWKR